MLLGNRNMKQILGAVLGKQHYIALINMARNYPEFWQNIFRYLTGSGQYPYKIFIRTPEGIISPTLYSHHDLLTVNEIFCRCDYFANKNDKIIVDFGSNIGISALYFLTRSKESKCYLYEPYERNIVKLRKNLTGFDERYILAEKAVSNEVGKVEFGIEPTGRYGGIGIKTGQIITVDCLDVNNVLAEILEKEQIIDILKIDTEGVEIRTVEAIKHELAKRIRKVYIEAHPERSLQATLFWQKQSGSVCQLIRKGT
jgi:FkbM family methyltransferase